MDVISQYYKPFDVVHTLNTTIKTPDLKLFFNWALFLASGAFFLTTLYALTQIRKTPQLPISLYLAVLGVMILADAAAVFFESKSVIQQQVRPQPSAIVSILISLVVGFVTWIIFKHHWHRFIVLNCKTSYPELFLITLMKMFLFAVVCYKAGQELRSHYYSK